MAGRLGDLPLQGDYGEKESHAAGKVPENPGLTKLSELHFSGSLTLGSWVADIMAHGTAPTLPKTAAEREEWAKEGQAQIMAAVKKMRITEAMTALKQHDEFTQKVIVPKFRGKLPSTIDSL